MIAIAAYAKSPLFLLKNELQNATKVAVNINAKHLEKATTY